MLRFLILCLNCVIFNAHANPTDMRTTTTKKFQNALTQQNLQTVLVSIEERLRNLDGIYSAQYSPSVEGKLEHYGRKLESVEAKISRLEAVMSNELDKISENISSKNFKDDIVRDHVLRKIDSVYERINHRLVYAELKLDMTEKKLENKLDTVLRRLEKIEDGITAKDSLLEEELADIVAVVEDIKSATDTIEHKIINVTKLINNTQSYTENFIQSDRRVVSERMNDVSRYMKDVKENLQGISISNENLTSALTKEIKEELNTFANKVVDFHDSSWKTYDRVEEALRSISLVANLTRYEMQNGIRSLTVQLGKKPHPNMLSDSTKDFNILEDLDKKIDSNFESIMLAQNLFLESCYRVQKDEAQLETKISEVLEKLIDTFAQKTTLEPKDLKRLEQLMKNHDQNSRRISQDIVAAIADLLQKSSTGEQKIDANLHLLRNNIEALYLMVQEKFDGDTSQAKIDEMVGLLKNLTEILSKTENQQNSKTNYPEIEELKHIIWQLQNMKDNVTSTGDANKYVQNIATTLNRIEMKINNTYYYFNDLNSTTSRIGKILEAYFQHYYETSRSNVTQNTTRYPERVRLINDIFSMMENLDNNSSAIASNPIVPGDIVITTEISNASGNIIFPGDSENDGNCTGIDVRFNGVDCLQLNQEQGVSNSTKNGAVETDIDVRFAENVASKNATLEMENSTPSRIPRMSNILKSVPDSEENSTENSTDIGNYQDYDEN